jgi:GDSL-like Lipase/Acylhydrolase family
MKIELKILACVALCLHVHAAITVAGEPGVSDSIVRRSLVSEGNTSRLKAVFEKARRGEPITVAAVGGSITAGGTQTRDPANRYIQQIARWFEIHFPNSKISFVNAGIGGTNSFYGAMRLQRDVLSKHPDLVIVEWAVNNQSGKDFAESYEGVLRQLLRASGDIAVIELFFMHKDGENAQMWQEILGRHYQLPMVSFRDAWWPEFASGRAQWDDLYADVVHPKDAGHLLAARLLRAFLEKTRLDPSASVPAAEIPKPLISDLYENCRFSSYENLESTANFGWARSADQKFWEGGKPGDFIEFEFSGQSLFLGYDFDKEQAPRAVFSIDGGIQQPLKEDAHRRPIAANLSAGVHKLRIEVQQTASASGSFGKLKIWGVGGAESGGAILAKP